MQLDLGRYADQLYLSWFGVVWCQVSLHPVTGAVLFQELSIGEEEAAGSGNGTDTPIPWSLSTITSIAFMLHVA
ncbi:hypothetical protein BX600DRAFT_446064 [Xylariales sp. PMI_506]|nr:hypothetical protein BX600DRAFT_446064 [Xylariales sp. PMI_506]